MIIQIGTESPTNTTDSSNTVESCAQMGDGACDDPTPGTSDSRVWGENQLSRDKYQSVSRIWGNSGVIQSKLAQRIDSMDRARLIIG
mmetsp:Transcript_29176/g.35543  ORF Transcript_29176/g.35543 Transcript_29176/m.35543 type:complete len:87 (+) Transcript_29176:3-263(+)